MLADASSKLRKFKDFLKETVQLNLDAKLYGTMSEIGRTIFDTKERIYQSLENKKFKEVVQEILDLIKFVEKYKSENKTQKDINLKAEVDLHYNMVMRKIEDIVTMI